MNDLNALVNKYMPNDLLSEDIYLLMEEMDELEQQKYLGELIRRASEVGITKEQVKRMFNATKKELRLEKIRMKVEQNETRAVALELDSKGDPARTVENYLRVFRGDEFFQKVKFNQFSRNAEWHENGIRKWKDVDDARSRHYIENSYGLSAPHKYDDALRIFLEEREYNPVKELIESIEWDGQPRIETMLTKWLKCEDSEYTREVSRLIFAGGIHRVYRPGCKFDDVPVLIGTKQGEGKSTFVRWLAMRDEWFSEVTVFEGSEGIEALEGAWICEVSEMLALTKVKEQEAVKSYITRQTDKRRLPYDKHTTDIERQCIFIGTTNKLEFLTDKTGNRRFYPVQVNCNAYDLNNSKEAVMEDIRQCWAEALVLFKANKLPAYANPELQNIIRLRQEEATEDDWRVGAIREFLERPGVEKTCVKHVWEYALDMVGSPTRKDSSDITAILISLGWQRTGRTEKLYNYGKQRTWVRGNERDILAEIGNNLSIEALKDHLVPT